MSYYTYFDLEIENPNNIEYSEEEIVQQLYEIWSLPNTQRLYKTFKEMFFDAMQWDAEFSEGDMIALSKLNPDLHFILYGNGEDAGDFWVEHFINGKYQLCFGRIVYDEFDENKMEEW